MKTVFSASVAAVLAVSSLSAEVEVFTGQPLVAGDAYLLAGWNFNSGGADDRETLLAVSHGSGTIQHSFVETNVQAFSGTALNAFAGDAAGGTLSLQGGSEVANNGADVTFLFSSSGFRDLGLTYAVRGTSTGFTSHSWQYSTDGVSFTEFQVETEVNASSFAVRAIDFSSVEVLNGTEEVFIRVVLDGGSSASGNNRIDNVQFRATATETTAGPGAVSLTNATSGSDYWGRDLFASGAVQAVALTLTGTGPTPIATVEISLPEGWSGFSLADISLGGPGFSGASASVSGRSVTISSAEVTEWAAGTAILALATPSGEAVADEGRFSFLVRSATAGEPLEMIGRQPQGRLVLPISLIRQVDAQGLSLLRGQEVAVSGVSTISSGALSTSQFSTYIQDETAGIALYNPSLDDFWSPATAGTRYTAIGTVSEYRGLTQIHVPGIEALIEHGADVMPEPLVVTPGELLAAAEQLEGTLVQIPRVSKAAGQWPDGTSGNLTIVAAGGPETLTLYINAYTDLPWNAEPQWPVDLIGIFTQYDSSSPFTDGYEIVPRAYSDILPASTPGDGSGVATLENVTSGSSYKGRRLFAPGTAQSVFLTIAAEEGVTLDAVSIALPGGWEGLLLENVTPSGPLASAEATVEGELLVFSNAAVTASSPGLVRIDQLITPSGEAIANFGLSQFTVKTALAGGELTEIALQPRGNLVLPISMVRAVDEQGVALALTHQVAISGVATAGSGVFSDSRLSAYLQDETGGVALDNPSVGNFPGDAVVAGNRYLVTGTVGQFRGLTQVDPGGPAGLVDLGPDAMPEPQLVTIARLLATAEELEGRLIRLSRVSKADPDQSWPTEGTWQNLLIGDGGADGLILRINQYTDIPSNPEPAFPLDMVGLVTQYASRATAPFEGGYQILPRAYSDFLPASEPEGGFARWRDGFFPGADPSIGGPAADPDGDGVSNLLEFALGANPHENSAAFLPEVSMAGAFFSMTFRRPKDAIDVVYTVEASSDLIHWTEIWTSVENAYPSVEPVIEQTVPDVVSHETAARRFLRLVVTPE